MVIIEKIKDFINNTEEKTFYVYLAAMLGVVIVLSSILVYSYYSSINFWQRRIRAVNELRDDVRGVLSKDETVAWQRASVNTMLQETPDFKIDGYLTEILQKFALEGNKLTSGPVAYVDHGDPEYREALLPVKFDMMNMKQLCELLNEIEQNKRVYTKDLEIIKSKKVPNTIEVSLTIGTLQRKPETT